MSGEDLYKNLEDAVVMRFSDRAQVRLGDLWKDQGVLLCLFRRWGCGVCRLSAVNISSLKPILDERNIALVGIGMDSIGVDEFIEERFFAGDLYLDAGMHTYTGINCKTNSWRNLWGLFSGAVFNLFKVAESKGYKSNNSGNYSRLGGTFLMAKGGRTVYRHFQTNNDFEPSLEVIVAKIGDGTVKLPDDFVLYPAYEERTRRATLRRSTLAPPAAMIDGSGALPA